MSFTTIPQELRNDVYLRLILDRLSEVEEVYIKKFVDHKTPAVKALMADIFMYCPIHAADYCRQTYKEVHEELLAYALRTSDVKFVVDVVNFDFRTVNHFLEYISHPDRLNQFASILGAPANAAKLIVEFTISKPSGFDPKKLGRWITARKNSTHAIQYRVRSIEKQDEVRQAAVQLDTVLGNSNPEARAIARAVIEYDGQKRAKALRKKAMREAGLAMLYQTGGMEEESEGDSDEGSEEDEDMDDENMSSEEDFTDEEMSDA